MGVIPPENITIGRRVVGTRAKACADDLDIADIRRPIPIQIGIFTIRT